MGEDQRALQQELHGSLAKEETIGIRFLPISQLSPMLLRKVP
jgi:hypothetical protein